MPKRVGYLYEKMLDKDLIRRVIISGSKGKRKRSDVKKVLSDIDYYVDRIYEMVRDISYGPTTPRPVVIRDKSSGKIRIIGVVPYFPDGIMHRLVTEVIRPVLMRGMYAHSCASIPGRGNMHAINYVKRALNDVRGSTYCAKLDIHHYYPSLKPIRIVDALSRKIKDGKILAIIYAILNSNTQQGITIGFYINQWLANFYLEPLDHMITSLPGVKYYVRNMDDMILIGPNKRKLHQAIDRISEKLKEMDLRLKDNWQVFKIDSRGVDFVGYRFFHNYTLLRRRNFLKMTRHCRRAKKIFDDGDSVSFHSASGLVSRSGQLKHCSGFSIRKKYYDPIGLGRLKHIIRSTSLYKNFLMLIAGATADWRTT